MITPPYDLSPEEEEILQELMREASQRLNDFNSKADECISIWIFSLPVHKIGSVKFGMN